MRLFVWSLVLVGCASADPGYGPASPTRSTAPVAESPAVATALEADPAPLPEGPDDGEQHAHHGMTPMRGDAATTEAPEAQPSHEGHGSE